MSDFVHYTVTDRVAVLTIDNPPVNALGQGVWEAVDEAVARAGSDSAADAIVLIGAGSTFVAGADINVFKTLKSRQQSLEQSGRTHALLKRMEDVHKPLVAAIHGNALGGGLEVAQACHFRVATGDARVGQPEVLLGIIPGAGGTQRLPRLCGVGMALEMSLQGKPVAALRALAAGIVDHIVAGDLLTGAIAFARSKANARAIRKTRDITLGPDQIKVGLEACAAARASLAKTAKGQMAPDAAVNAIEAGLQRPFDEGSTRERELFAFVDLETVRLFGFTRSHPLVKAVCRNQAPAGFQCIPERGLRGRRFRPCVDHLGSTGRVLRPRWNESPAHQRQFPDRLLGTLADHRDGLCWRDVVSRNPILFA